MNQLSSITPLEIILIGSAAVGVFLFFRACWRNIKRSRQHFSVALLTLMMSLTAQTAWANDAVTYIDMDGKTQTVTGYTEVTSDMTTNNNGYFIWYSGWYVVKSDVTLNGRITFARETIHLIVCDGATLTVNGDDYYAFYGQTLNIYAQSTGTGMGAINAKEKTDCNNLNIAGGTVTLEPNKKALGLEIEKDGDVTINGGDVTILNHTSGIAAIYFLGAGSVTLNGGKLTVSNSAEHTKCAIEGKSVNVNFNGGTAEINGEIYGCQNLNLKGGDVTVNGEIKNMANGYAVIYDYTSITDSYYIQSFNNTLYTGKTRTVKVKVGKKFLCNGKSYSGKLTDSQISAISGQTMTPNTSDDFADNSDGTYTIKTAKGWGYFCDLLEGKAKGYFTDKTVKLENNISVTRMAGADYHDFTGTFNGQGHTLTFNYTTDAENAAPFRNVESGCVIKNLRVAGTITTSNKYAAGIIAQQYGTVTIQNCRSSVIIKSNLSGDGTHGGLVAVNNNSANLTIEGCVFDGKLLTTGATATTHCGGFLGYNKKTVTITNSLYAPAALENGETEITGSSATFVRNGSAGSNCYYTRTLGTAQGTQAHSITAGEHVSVANAGTATNEYSGSGITFYGTGIKFGNVLYAGSGDEVSLRITSSTGYQCSNYTADAGTFSGEANPFTLTMPDADVTISATSFVANEGDGTADHPYIIDNWNTFCDWITYDYDNSKDKHYKLGVDVSTTKMLGTLDYPFCGTFDGNGHTLTVNFSATTHYCAPFCYVSGSNASVMIKNLHIAGAIITNTYMYGAGIVGKVMDNGNVTIDNCRSSVVIQSDYSGNGRHSGFVSRGDADATISIKGCVFDGSINAANSGQCAGFLASKQNSSVNVTIENCLFAPTVITIAGNDNKTFARGNNNSITNCYYTKELGDAQGTQADYLLSEDEAVPSKLDGTVVFRREFNGGKASTICLSAVRI